MHIRFYHAQEANCCERILWMLNYKQLAYERIDVGLGDVGEHVRLHSPFARVPLMEVDGIPLSESMAMAEFIEEIAPQPPLQYTDLFARAQVREICEAVNSSIHPQQNGSTVRYFHPEWSREQMKPVRAKWLHINLDRLQPRLWRSSQFAVGTQFTQADIFVSIIYRKAVDLGIPVSDLPRYEQYWQFLMSQEAIRNSCPVL
ncbi:glutathione S-transferase family protein [Undibacterium sp. TS12]|uniref:glutathione S-transferase family protein n=1 Tax=Undibacterium sp. TS12 TaxID=2908202 RepID=UPI001F4C8A69|nr:glutathione S-transferase family protein [Undibacterium sp. TS12]MCH8622127.1 glutathione S-transferase family protein [Undibacterium sp. TS12]